ncbi:ArsR/SmtB family transcription factor [Kitasatospora sp. NPDC004240]
MSWVEPTGDALLLTLQALAHPQRLRILAALADGRDYVSHLAREVGMSRPLLYMHLKRLEESGLVVGSLELSTDGKAMKYFELTPFHLQLTPESLAEAVASLSEGDAAKPAADKGSLGDEKS